MSNDFRATVAVALRFSQCSGQSSDFWTTGNDVELWVATIEPLSNGLEIRPVERTDNGAERRGNGTPQPIRLYWSGKEWDSATMPSITIMEPVPWDIAYLIGRLGGDAVSISMGVLYPEPQ